MNNDQRNGMNNQVDNGGNQKGQPGSKGNTMTAPMDHSQGGLAEGNQQMGNQPATIGGAQNGQRGTADGMENSRSQGSSQGGSQSGSMSGASQQDDIAGRESNDAAGGYPRSPGGANQLAGDQKMDDDTGLSNTANRQSVEDGNRQSEQSNVGRRDDGTPD